MTSPFEQSAPQLWANGYSAIPIWPNTKKPHFQGGSNWAALYCNRLPNDNEQASWMEYRDAGVGVCLGAASNLVAIDFDNDVDGMQAKIEALLPESPVKKRGAKGYTAFYRFNSEASKGLSVGGVRVLDILASGRQTILPLSLHPDTGLPYIWLTEATLENTLAADLPIIPSEVMREIHALFAPKRPATPAWQTRPAPTENTDDLSVALSYIPADDYDIWLQVGMALKQELGQRGYLLWDKWSALSSKYDTSVMNTKWSSFNRSDITVGTVYHMAKTYGYIQQPPAIERPRAEFVMPSAGAVAPIPMSNDIFNAPGLVGRTMKWILDTSIYPLPILALASSIAAVGAAMSHKVQSPTRLRTNFYTLGLAASGAGKGHAMKAIGNIYSAAGMGGYIAGAPASGAGLLTGLRENSGKAVILWDEIGRVLTSLNGKNSGSYQRDILTYMMEIFSKADSSFQGVQYANHDGKQKRTPIEQPCLNIYGATTPDRFYQALTGDDAVDGFLARFLVFEATGYTVEPEENINDSMTPPDDLVAEYSNWKDAASNCNPQGNMDGAMRIAPRVVPYSPEAKALIKEYELRMRRITLSPEAIAATTSPIYARSAEHAMKLSLVAHDGDAIGEEAMVWAIAVADYCTALMLKAVKQNVSSSDFERLQKRVLRVISEKKGEWITHTEVSKKTQEMPSRIRQEVIQNMVDGGVIEMVQENPPGGMGAKLKRYRSFAGL